MHSGCKRGKRPPPPLIVILFVTILFAKPPNRIYIQEKEKYVCLQVSLKTLYDGSGGGDETQKCQLWHEIEK